MKTLDQLIKEKQERERKACTPAPLMNDPFVTMCAYSENQVIKTDSQKGSK